MEPSGTEATLFQLVDVAGVGGDANYELPDARLLAYRQLLLKGNASGTIAITAPHGDSPEIAAAGGVLVATGVGDVWPVAMLYSDGVRWNVLAQD